MRVVTFFLRCWVAKLCGVIWHLLCCVTKLWGVTWLSCVCVVANSEIWGGEVVVCGVAKL